MVADWKYITGEEYNRQTWALGTGAKDYGIWDMAQGIHPQQTGVVVWDPERQ